MALAVFAPRADMLVPTGTAPVAETHAAPAPMYVQFRLDAPNASSVQLVGSFTGWEPRYELHETSPGVWSVLVPLKPGVHDYGFMVDGERWVVDPKAPQVDDQFGGTNSRLSLAPPSGAA
jgi:1,4-alpha-glucan branching enzyme